jgi:hypothetical protein
MSFFWDIQILVHEPRLCLATPIRIIAVTVGLLGSVTFFWSSGMRTIMSLAAIYVMVFVIAAPAQDEVKPGPEHEKLKAQEGTWDGTAVINGKESKAVKTEKLGLGNLWLIEHFQTDIDGVKFEGHGMTTYDSLKKKYVNIWIDSMSTSPMISEGNFEKGNRLVMKGKFSTPDGKTLDFTTITERKDENHMVVVVDGTGPDGKNVEFIKITYKRRQK